MSEDRAGPDQTAPFPFPRRWIVESESLEFLRRLPDGSIDLIYIDPPFNTGRRQERRHLRVFHDPTGGDRVGFGGRRYRTLETGRSGWEDRFDDYPAFLVPRLRQAHRVLRPDGSLFVHLDYREAHYCKVALDEIFGRDAFQNEIIWAYDYGGRSRRRWPAKHDTILWYTRDPARYTFNYDEIDRIPYMAPRLVSREKAARGKTPTDVWWHTIVSPTGREKTGYPTQKPLVILERIVRVHSRPGDRVLDFFAGSGTTGEAAARLGRDFVLVDVRPEAVAVMATRLAPWKPRIDRPGVSAPAVGEEMAAPNRAAARGADAEASDGPGSPPGRLTPEVAPHRPTASPPPRAGPAGDRSSDGDR